MIELFSKGPAFIDDLEGIPIVPLPVDDEISSLSAILLDPDYYEFMKTGRKIIGGVTVLDEAHLIPFKAKAYIDLSERKASGEHVNAGDLMKHKKDVFRLAQLLGPDIFITLVQLIKEDMQVFCQMALSEGVHMQQLGIPMTVEEAVDLLGSVKILSQN